MRRQFLICSCLALLLSLAAMADTLAVAGHSQQLIQPLVVAGDEVLAPLVPSLRLLGATVAVQDRSLDIAVPGHPSLHLTAGAAACTVDGRKIALPVAPRLHGSDWLLPAKALAPLLGAQASFDAATRTLTLLPLLDAGWELRPEGLAVLVRSAAPLQFTSGEERGGICLTYDFKATAVAAEALLAIQAGGVDGLRVLPAASSVRLAVDCIDPASATAAVSDNGRLVTILVGKRTTPIPPAAAPDAPPPLDPVPLQDITLRKHSEKVTELTLATGGPTRIASDYDRTTRRLTLTVANGLNTLDVARLRDLHDGVVTSVQAEGKADAPGTQVVITFAQDAGFLLQQDDRAVRMLLGTFDISDMTVVLDAGHGDQDTGAVGVNGTLEKRINLDVILRIGRLLEGAGARVVCTRKDDTFIPLNDRPGLANRIRADIFVSVHCNSMPRPNSASGTQCYYRTPQSRALAEAVHPELVKAIGLRDGGIRTANFLVIRKSAMPAILLELAFLNNTREEALLRTPEFRQRAAEGIVSGIRRYAATKDWQLHKTEVPLDLSAPRLAVTADPVE